jgi:hypothetical protein
LSPILAAAFFLIAWAGPACAQQATFRDALLDHLAGRWTLKGIVAKRQAVHDVSARWVLNHQYLEFRETSRDRNKAGDPAYVADVFIGWDDATRGYVCVWLDDYGDISTQSLGHAPRNGNSIGFVFQDTADSGRFHTTFTYVPATRSWTMNMDQETNGKLSPFARTTLVAAN